MQNGNGNLVLSRMIDQSIVIGDSITITVLRIERGQVRLAISAPKNLSVHRAEVWNDIKRQERQQ